MIIEDLSTLKIHRLSQEKFDRENANGNLDETAIYLTPDVDIAIITLGTCETAAATAAKVVTLNEGSQWELKPGAVIAVKFTKSNTAGTSSTPVTLNVNSTGAYPIWYNNAKYTGNSTTVTGSANRVMTYMFDGEYYVWLSAGYMNSPSQASLGQGYGTCSTAANTTAKIVTLSSYTLATGGIVSVKFDNAVPANATMNINSRGAKAIYYRGSAITDGIIKAGDTATFIYSTNYHLISIDSSAQLTGGTLEGNLIFEGTEGEERSIIFPEYGYEDLTSLRITAGGYSPKIYSDEYLTIESSNEIDIISGGAGTYIDSDSAVEIGYYTPANSVFIHNLAEPSAEGDAVSKKYVDSALGNKIIVSDTEPENATAGTIWIDMGVEVVGDNGSAVTISLDQPLSGDVWIDTSHNSKESDTIDTVMMLDKNDKIMVSDTEPSNINTNGLWADIGKN